MTNTTTMTAEELEKKVRNYGKKAKALQIKILEDAGVYNDEIHGDAKNRKETYSKLLTGEIDTMTPVEPVEAVVGDVSDDNNTTTDTSDAPTTTEPSNSDEVVDFGESTDPQPEMEAVVLTEKQREKLAELAEEIILNRKEELFVPEDTPKPKERRQSKYQIGLALREARKIFPSDKEFGEWVQTEINDELLSSEQKVLNQKTLYNYRQLAEFGTFETCEDVGFTNVYNLMKEGNEDKLALVQSLINGDTMYEETGAPATGKEVGLAVKEILGVKSKTKMSQEDMDAMMEGMYDEDAYLEAQERAEEKAQMRVYLNYFGIEEDELCIESIKVAHRAAMKRFHPDHHGNTYINDFNFSNVAAEFLKGML